MTARAAVRPRRRQPRRVGEGGVMSYHECPQCGDEFEMVMVSGYESDTNAGPFYEPRQKTCACDLTSEQWDKIETEAHQSYLDGYDPLD